MQTPHGWGRSTQQSGVFALGGAGWEITWSPEQIHPYSALWLHLASRFGPPGELAPGQDLWSFGLQTKSTAC